MKKPKNIILLSIALISTTLLLYFVVFYFTQNGKSFYRCPNFLEYENNGEYKSINCAERTKDFAESIYCDLKYRNWVIEHCPHIGFSD